MNFLSHFYFDRNTDSPLQVMGVVLPDLMKNANKKWNIHPEKHQDQYLDSDLLDIFSGWQRHIEVDKYFHCSDFFLHHTHKLRTTIAPFMTSSPARPSFIAHIALELMLDSLLLTEISLDTEKLYSQLGQSSEESLRRFFKINSIDNADEFFSFLEEFIEARYLNTYADPNEIVYALNRICMRIWDNPMNDTQKMQLKAVVMDYLMSLKTNYLTIFEETERRLQLLV